MLVWTRGGKIKRCLLAGGVYTPCKGIMGIPSPVIRYTTASSSSSIIVIDNNIILLLSLWKHNTLWKKRKRLRSSAYLHRTNRAQGAVPWVGSAKYATSNDIPLAYNSATPPPPPTVSGSNSINPVNVICASPVERTLTHRRWRQQTAKYNNKRNNNVHNNDRADITHTHTRGCCRFKAIFISRASDVYPHRPPHP